MGKVDTGWLMHVPRFREFCELHDLRIANSWMVEFVFVVHKMAFASWNWFCFACWCWMNDVLWRFFKRFASIRWLFIRCNFMNGLFLLLDEISFQPMTIPLVFLSVLVIAVFQIFIINSPVARERLTERNLISTGWSRMTWPLNHGHGRLGS